MGFSIVISELASFEIKKSINFYESRKKGLGKEYLLYLKGYFLVLQSNPLLFPIKHKNIFRELPLKKFPFIIIYELLNDTVVIYSVFHTSRNPSDKP